MSHTTGPWRVIGGSIRADSQLVADVHQPTSPENQSANAHLIAAAPDAVSIMEDLQEYLCEQGGAGVELLERVDAWLTKAKGYENNDEGDHERNVFHLPNGDEVHN